MPRNLKESLRSGIFQFSLVTISVWLALMANDWSERQKKKNDTQLLLTKFQAEIQVNQERLESTSTYYRQLDDSLEINIPKETKKVNSVSFYNFWKGKIEPNFQDYVFQLALATGKMNDIDIELAMSLMDLYKRQQLFAELIDQYDQEGWQEKNTLERMIYLSSLTHDVALDNGRLKSKLIESLDMTNAQADK